MSSPSAAATSPGTLAIDTRQLPWIRRLSADYAYAFENVAPFYAGDPQSDADWRTAIAAAQRGQRATPRLRALLQAQQHARQAPAEAVTAAQRFDDASTVAVVTGQQAGLFGGPLYSLHKAITAIKLAAEVTRRHGVPAVPVFWIDAEDHDWDEVRGCTILDGEHEARRIELAPLAGAGLRSIGRLQLADQGGDAVAALGRALAPTEFTDALLTRLAEAYAPGRTMASAFGRVLEDALGRHGLVVFDASDPAAKALVAEVFARALTPPGATARLAALAGVALEQRGYHAQVTPSEQTAPLFAIDGGREPVRWQGDSAIAGDRTVPLSTLAAEAAAQPEAFSPNVLLRPIVQDTIFPTACYVGGPAELAYFAQLKGIYEHFGVPMPLVAPRASATIVDSATLRALGKHDLPFAAYQRQDELTLNQLLERQLPPEVESSFADAGTALASRLDAIRAAAAVVDSTLEGAASSTLARMQHDLQTLHNKVVQAAKRKDETLRRQFKRTQAQLFPNGQPQERELGWVWLLNRYGPAAVDRLLDLLPLDAGHHWVLTI